MSRQRLFALPLLAMLALAGCLGGMVRGLAPVEIGGGLSVELPASPSDMPPFSAGQTLLARFGETTLLLSLRLHSDGETLRMAAVDGLGRRAVTMTWRDATIDAQLAEWLPVGLPASRLLADIFLAQWPVGIVEKAVRNSGGRVKQRDSLRIVSRDGVDVVRIEYAGRRETPWSGTTHYSNVAAGYSIEIVSAELSE